MRHRGKEIYLPEYMLKALPELAEVLARKGLSFSGELRPAIEKLFAKHGIDLEKKDSLKARKGGRGGIAGVVADRQGE